MEGVIRETQYPKREEKKPRHTLVRRSFRELHGKPLFKVIDRSQKLNAAGSEVMHWLARHPFSTYAKKFHDEREYFFFGDANDSHVVSFSWNKINKEFTIRDIFPVGTWNANNRAVQLQPRR